MKPNGCDRQGDDYLVSWDEMGVGLEFTRLRETDAAIRALVTPVSLDDRKRLLAPVWSNLFTLADRERLAKAIVERIESKEGRNLAEWKDSVERAFAMVIDTHSTPEPLVILGKEPRSPNQGYLVWPFLARNQVNILLADQGSGKSYIGLAIGQAVSAGRADMLPEPFRLLGKGPVIYYDAETDLAAQQLRQERLAAALGLDDLPDIHYRHIKPPLANYASILRKDVAETRAVLVIFDSLTFLSGGNLNDSEVAVPTMNAIGECGAETTKLCLAHHGKAGREQGAKPSVIGFSGFEFKARSIWMMRRMNDDGEGVSHIDQAWTNHKTNDDRQHRGFGVRVAFNEDNTSAELRSLGMHESAWLAKTAGSAEERIRAALLDTEFWRLSTPDLAKAAGVSEQTIRRICPEMHDVRQASVGGQGRGKSSAWELVLVKGGRQNGTADHEIKPTPYREINGVAFPPSGESNKSNTPKSNTVALLPTPIPDSGTVVSTESDDLMNLPF